MRDKVFSLIVFGLFFVVVAGTGCRSLVPVSPTESNRRDSIRTEIVYQHDSIFTDRWHTIIQKGDTIFKIDSIYVADIRWLEKHDTTRIVSSDTITNVVEVEKELTGGQVFMIRSGWALWVILAVVLIAGIVIAAVKLRRL